MKCIRTQNGSLVILNQVTRVYVNFDVVEADLNHEKKLALGYYNSADIAYTIVEWLEEWIAFDKEESVFVMPKKNITRDAVERLRIANQFEYLE